jgi:hypothetical protein
MAEAHNRGAIGARLKAAIKYLIETKDDLQEAAIHAGMSTFRLRESLKKPHVRRFFQQEKQALLDIYSAQNPNRLRDIADKSPNQMARIQAIRTMEQLGDDDDQQQRRREPITPGLVVVINAGPDQRVIEHGPAVPAIEHRVDARQKERSHGG